LSLDTIGDGRRTTAPCYHSIPVTAGGRAKSCADPGIAPSNYIYS
jgi:hypothetical protein